MTGAFSGATLLLYSLGLGAVLGTAYDVLRIRRIAMAPTGSYGTKRAPMPLSAWKAKAIKRRRAGTILLLIEDVLFALLAAVLFLLLFYSLNSGVVRWYAFAGAGLSFCLYRLTVGQLIMRLADRIVACIRKLLSLFLRWVLLPILRQIIRPICFVVRRFRMLLRRRKSKRLEHRLLRMAARGELPSMPKRKRKKRGKGLRT